MVALFAIVRDVFVHNLLLSNFANTRVIRILVLILSVLIFHEHTWMLVEDSYMHVGIPVVLRRKFVKSLSRSSELN